MIRELAVNFNDILLPDEINKFILSGGAKYLKEKGWVYSGTTGLSLTYIAKKGLVPTDTLWTDKPAVYGSLRPHHAWQWYGNIPETGILLRTRYGTGWRKQVKWDPKDPVVYNFNVVPPNKLQILTKQGWASVLSIEESRVTKELDCVSPFINYSC